MKLIIMEENVMKDMNEESNSPIIVEYNIPYEVLSDDLSSSDSSDINEIFQTAVDTIQDGGRVIITHNFINSPSQVSHTFYTLEELETYRKKHIKFKHSR